MTHVRFAVLAACAAAIGAVAPPAVAGERRDGGGSGASLRAGTASADITPPVGTPMFAYTDRSRLLGVDGVLQILADPAP